MGWIRYKTVELGDDISIRRGDTLEVVFSGLNDLTTASDIWFGVKSDKDDSDLSAKLLVSEVDGLLRIEGGAPTAAVNGSITVTDAAGGDITVAVAAVEMAKLELAGSFYYDAQVLYADGTVTTETKGRAYIIGDVTRRIV